MKKIMTALSLAVMSISALANEAAISAQFKKLGASSVEVKPSPIANLKTVVTDNGIFYASQDGKYILQGKLFELTDKGPVDISNALLMDKLNSHKDEMIIYPAKNEKHVVTIFTDITCPYCQKLHQQMKEYNDLGITIRYLAFPRAGLNNNTAKQMEAIWSTKDPAFAFNEYEKGNAQSQLKTPNIVKKHYELGLQFDVRGTPSIVTEKGEVFGGYLEPQALLAALEE